MKKEAVFSQIIQTPFSAETAMTSQVIENEEGTAMNHLLIIVGKQIFCVTLTTTENAQAFKTVCPEQLRGTITTIKNPADLAQALGQHNVEIFVELAE